MIAMSLSERVCDVLDAAGGSLDWRGRVAGVGVFGEGSLVWEQSRSHVLAGWLGGWWLTGWLVGWVVTL
jgi:hypothetical protein